MNKRDYSRKAEQAKQVERLALPKILESQTYLTLQNEKRDVKLIPVEMFDAWVDSLCEEITGVNRAVWDVFARWRFINSLIAEDILVLRHEADGTILLIETEEKTSAEDAQEGEQPCHTTPN